MEIDVKPFQNSNKSNNVIMPRNVQRLQADLYQGLFNFFNQEHDLILTIEEMDEIIYEVEKHNEQF